MRGRCAIGVIDVGSNTTRLLVASVERDGSSSPSTRQKVRLSLGEEIERHGAVSDVHIAAAAKAVRKLAASRAGAGASTRSTCSSPLPAGRARTPTSSSLRSRGRPASGTRAHDRGGGHARLPRARSRRPTSRCRTASPSATSAARPPRSPSARPAAIPDWIESVDLGSVRLTARAADMPSSARGRGCVRARRARRRSKPRSPSAAAPAPRAGSSAPRLGEAELAEALRHRRDDFAARGRPALRRRSRARRDPPGRRRSCSPRCSGGSASRSTCATAASARAPCSPR